MSSEEIETERARLQSEFSRATKEWEKADKAREDALSALIEFDEKHGRPDV